MGGETGEAGLGPVSEGPLISSTEFVFLSGSNGEPLKTFEQESGSIEDLEFQENLLGAGGS